MSDSEEEEANLEALLAKAKEAKAQAASKMQKGNDGKPVQQNKPQQQPPKPQQQQVAKPQQQQPPKPQSPQQQKPQSPQQHQQKPAHNSHD
jgi:hypothetical protein